MSTPARSREERPRLAAVPSYSDPDAYIREHGPLVLCATAGVRYAPDADREVGPTGAPPGYTPFRRRRARIQRREVERVSPAEQERRWAAMLDNLDALAVARVAERWPLDGGGDGPRGAEEMGAKKAREQGEAEERQRAKDRAWLDRQAAKRRPTQQGPSATERALLYIARLPPSISGSGGHGALWSAALALVKGFAIPADEALRMLAAEFNPRCHPAWSRHEMIAKVKSATRAHKPLGYLLHAEQRP